MDEQLLTHVPAWSSVPAGQAVQVVLAAPVQLRHEDEQLRHENELAYVPVGQPATHVPGRPTR